MNILITGGAGFIGKSLFEVLNPSYNIVSCNSSQLNLLNSNQVSDFIKKGRFDVVIHTATYDAAPATSTKDPAKVIENNLKMFFHLARCSSFFGKMIYFGTGAEYDRENWVPHMKECYFDKNVPADPYGFSKYVMSQYTLKSENIYNLRLFGLFGKYDDWRYRLIPNLCCRALYGMPLVMNQNNRYDFLFIDDLIKIVQWMINSRPIHKIYNTCSGSVYDFNSIAKTIIDVSGKPLEIQFKKSGPGIEYSADNSLLLEEVNKIEFTSLKDSIKQLYHWYESNSYLIDKQKLV